MKVTTMNIAHATRSRGSPELRPIIVLYGLLGFLCALMWALQPEIVGVSWFSNILLFAAPVGFFAAAQTIVLLTRGIDLSVTAAATACAYIMATNPEQGLFAILMGLTAATAVGVLNGVGIGLFAVSPLIMTLATSLVTIGGLTVYSQSAMGEPSTIPHVIQSIGSGKIWGIPNNLFVWAVFAIGLVVILRRTGFGRLLYAVGDNEEAVRLCGIKVHRIIIVNYSASAFLSGIAGLLLVGSTNAADLGLANAYLLPSVAAAVIGGVSIFGGKGSYIGAIGGALVLTVLNSFLTFYNAGEPLKQIIYGAIILTLAAIYNRIA
jgi:ribose transport system permease protein